MRKKLLSGLAALLVASSVAVSCKDAATSQKNDRNKWVQLDINTSHQVPTLPSENAKYGTAPLRDFDDNLTLIACDNPHEYDQVMESLEKRNNLRGSKFKLSTVKRDKYTKVTVPNRNSHGKITNSYLHVVTKDNLMDVIATMKQKGLSYDIVQMRGHQYQPMRELFSLTQNAVSKNAIYLFGGCNSYDLAEEKSSFHKPVMGGYDTQEASRNTRYLLNLIEYIDTPDAKDWSTLHNKMIWSDSHFKKFYFPRDN